VGSSDADGEHVITDEFTDLFGGLPYPLKDWIRNEIEWLNQGAESGFWTTSERVFEFSGPLPRAFWFMMSGRSHWAGTAEELLETLCKFRSDLLVTGWPSGPAALVQALVELSPTLSDVGLEIERADDGRFLVERLADPQAGAKVSRLQ
jgi:hypothetical protein